MQIQFSLLGCVYLLLLMIPNLIWVKHQPPGYDPDDEAKWLLVIERSGEIAVSTLAIVSVNDGEAASKWLLWLSFLFMVLYEIYWIRYFKQVSLQRFYGSFLCIPLPGASLPLLAFLLFGFYTHDYLLVISVLFFAIGHLGIHLHHARKHHISLL